MVVPTSWWSNWRIIMNANRIGLAVAAGVLAVAGLAGCGAAATGDATTNGASGATTNGASGATTNGGAVDVPATLSADGQALAMVGFDVADLTTEADDQGGSSPAVDTGGSSPAVVASSAAGRHGPAARRKALRRIALRRNVQHGEFTVQTKQGEKTVAVQRGTVVAVSATSVTVKCADGLVQTWALDDKLHVVKDKAKATPGAITVGAAVGVAGVKNGTGYLARLVLIPAK
jgi:hypothetical protein